MSRVQLCDVCMCDCTSSAVPVPYSTTALIPWSSSAGHGTCAYFRSLPPALTACPKLCQRASYAARLAPTLPCSRVHMRCEARFRCMTELKTSEQVASGPCNPLTVS